MNPIIEVAIGVILVFLVVAVMVSSITEVISGFLHVRASTLERGIEVMLGDAGKNWLYQQPLIATSMPPAGIFRRGTPEGGKEPKRRSPSYIDAVTFATTLAARLSVPTSETLLALVLPDENTRRARIQGATDVAGDIRKAALEKAGNADTLAAYLLGQPTLAQAVVDLDGARAVVARLDPGDPAKGALQALLDQDPPATPADLVRKIASYPAPLSTPRLSDAISLTGGFPMSDSARDSLRTLAQRADGELARFREQVEDWFDHEMARISGLYNRWSQAVMLLVGLVIAAGFNISAYTVGRALWVDQTLRAKAVAAAEQTVSSTATSTIPTTSATSLPSTPSYQELKSYGLPLGWNSSSWPSAGGDIALHVLGWLAIAIAGSFGAPFWFDTLNKLVNLRTSGPPPPKAADRRPGSGATA